MLIFRVNDTITIHYKKLYFEFRAIIGVESQTHLIIINE